MTSNTWLSLNIVSAVAAARTILPLVGLVVGPPHHHLVLLLPLVHLDGLLSVRQVQERLPGVLLGKWILISTLSLSWVIWENL